MTLCNLKLSNTICTNQVVFDIKLYEVNKNTQIYWDEMETAEAEAETPPVAWYVVGANPDICF